MSAQNLIFFLTTCAENCLINFVKQCRKINVIFEGASVKLYRIKTDLIGEY